MWVCRADLEDVTCSRVWHGSKKEYQLDGHNVWCEQFLRKVRICNCTSCTGMLLLKMTYKSNPCTGMLLLKMTYKSNPCTGMLLLKMTYKSNPCTSVYNSRRSQEVEAPRFPDSLCGYEFWSSGWERNTEKNIHTQVRGSNERGRGWQKLHNHELHRVYVSWDIIMVMRWAVRVARMVRNEKYITT